MEITLKKHDNGNIELTIPIPWANVHKTYDAVVDDIVKETELHGFRKGKAPRIAVEEHLDKNKTYEEVLKRLLPDIYIKAIGQHSIKPIISPQVTLKKAKEGEDWVVMVITCEKPVVTLGEYRQAIAELKNEKRNKIWVPGQDKQKENEKEKEQKPNIDEILGVVYKTIQVSLPAILVEQEVSRMLSNLIDQTKKLGLTVEQYLNSTGKTIESLRKDYEEEAKRMIALELALGDIADKENINVEEKDIDNIIQTAKTPEEKENLEKERYYLASMLRRQKTIQMLASL